MFCSQVIVCCSSFGKLWRIYQQLSKITRIVAISSRYLIITATIFFFSVWILSSWLSLWVSVTRFLKKKKFQNLDNRQSPSFNSFNTHSPSLIPKSSKKFFFSQPTQNEVTHNNFWRNKWQCFLPFLKTSAVLVI